jgi:hypothetical protein
MARIYFIFFIKVLTKIYFFLNLKLQVQKTKFMLL